MMVYIINHYHYYYCYNYHYAGPQGLGARDARRGLEAGGLGLRSDAANNNNNNNNDNINNDIINNDKKQ